MKLEADLNDAGLLVDSFNWEDLVDYGFCIPVSYALAQFFTLRNRPARVVETTLRGVDPINARWFDVEPYIEGFLGHAVTILPTSNLLLDGSLWSQKSKVMANTDLPSLLVAQWAKNKPTYAQIGRLKLMYEPDLKAKSWSKRSWPWKEIDKQVKRFDIEVRKGGGP